MATDWGQRYAAWREQQDRLIDALNDAMDAARALPSGSTGDDVDRILREPGLALIAHDLNRPSLIDMVR